MPLLLNTSCSDSCSEDKDFDDFFRGVFKNPCVQFDWLLCSNHPCMACLHQAFLSLNSSRSSSFPGQSIVLLYIARTCIAKLNSQAAIKSMVMILPTHLIPSLFSSFPMSIVAIANPVLGNTKVQHTRLQYNSLYPWMQATNAIPKKKKANNHKKMETTSARGCNTSIAIGCSAK